MINPSLLFYSAALLFLMSMSSFEPFAASQEEAKEEEEEEEFEKEEFDLGEPSLEEEPGEEEGIMGAGKLAPPSFFGAPAAKDLEEEEKKEEEEGAPGKKAAVPGKVIVEEPAWEEKTTRFFEASGYFRLRSDLFYRLDMGFPPDNPRGPFPVPYESRYNPQVQADYEDSKVPCGQEGSHYKWCGKHLLTGANIRLRVEPVISLSELVKIKAQIDILDNLVLGSTPEGYSAHIGTGGFEWGGTDPWVPLVAFSGTQVPPSWRNSLSNPISVRTAWGEVLLKNIGILKFGRMPSAWGLGLLENDGRCLDCNYGDIADRILFATKLFDTIFAAGWDFPASGPTSQTFIDQQGQPYDVSVADDLYQWLGVIAYKLEKEEEERRLALEKPVLSCGVYYLYRKQLLSAMEGDIGTGEDPEDYVTTLVERDAKAHIIDPWIRFLIGDFRAELEWVIVVGSIGNLGLTTYEGSSLDVLMSGGVIQLEHLFLEDRLGVRFEFGYASGDPNLEGLSPRGSGLLMQEPGKGEERLTAFRFDPDYNVDLVLFEEILGQVSASYYFKPSIYYWFVKDHFFGQFDIIYSRASEFVSTNGNNGNLGVEFDISLKYKTADRFTGMLQYAYLVPLPGWEDLPGLEDGFRNLSHPMTLQLMLAIEY